MNAKKLSDNYRAEETAKSFVLPVGLTKKQKELASDQLEQARARLQAEASEKELLVAGLMQLKFQLEDYIQSDAYDPNKR